MTKKAIILGNGPSLNEINLDLLVNRKDVSTLACNRIDLLFDKTDWRPDYYFSFSIHAKEKKKEWVKSAATAAKNDKTVCFLHKELRSEIPNTRNVNFIKDLREHSRHSPIPSDLFEIDFNDVQLKSFSATVPLFQFCFSNKVKTIGIIGQDGYIFDENDNHFDFKYGYETNSFQRANERIIALHNIIKKHSLKNGIKVYNLTRRSIIKSHPHLELKDFLNL